MPEIFIADEKRTKTLLDRLKNNSLKVKTFDSNTIDIQNNKNIILLNINSEIYSSLNLENSPIIKMTPKSNNQLLSENELKEKLYDLFLKLKVQRNQYVGIPYFIDSIICCYYDKSLFSKGLKAIYREVEKNMITKLIVIIFFGKLTTFSVLIIIPLIFIMFPKYFLVVINTKLYLLNTLYLYQFNTLKQLKF